VRTVRIAELQVDCIAIANAPKVHIETRTTYAYINYLSVCHNLKFACNSYCSIAKIGNDCIDFALYRCAVWGLHSHGSINTQVLHHHAIHLGFDFIIPKAVWVLGWVVDSVEIGIDVALINWQVIA
jgi:hypothetical protein